MKVANVYLTSYNHAKRKSLYNYNANCGIAMCYSHVFAMHTRIDS